MSEPGWRNRLLEIGGRRVPFLRWSVLRMALGGRTLLKTWQVGDGREEALAQFVDFIRCQVPVLRLSGQPEFHVAHLLQTHHHAQARHIGLRSGGGRYPLPRAC